MAKLSVMQMRTVPDVDENLATIDRLLSVNLNNSELDTSNEEHLVVLPECCLFFGGTDYAQLALAIDTYREDKSSNRLINALSALAQKYNIYLVAGSIPLLSQQTLSSDANQKFTNTSLVFSPSGQILCSYDKIHLFDVVVNDSEKNYLESKYAQPGERIVSTALPFAHLGLTICYDLRFPELFRSLTANGSEIITVPAAFTKVTGEAHWQALLQARAIENQVYILAAGQEGTHANGRETWGHSVVISPWGEILAEITQGEGMITVPFCREKLEQARNSIPVAMHNKFQVEMKV